MKEEEEEEWTAEEGEQRSEAPRLCAAAAKMANEGLGLLCVCVCAHMKRGATGKQGSFSPVVDGWGGGEGGVKPQSRVTGQTRLAALMDSLIFIISES